MKHFTWWYCVICCFWIVTTAEKSFEPENDALFDCKTITSTAVDCTNVKIGNNATFWRTIADKNIQELKISHNELELIPPNISRLSELSILDLSNNNIRRIGGNTFSRLRKLELLDLSKNNLKSLSEINAGTLFSTNIRLRTLNLSYNHLTDLGNGYEEIIYSGSLMTLDVSYCEINYIQGPLCLQGVENLKFLNLSHNPIIRLDGLTSNSVISLDVSGSNLQFLRSDSLDQLYSLKELLISHNSRLNNQFFRPNSKTVEIFDASFCSLDSTYLLELQEIRKVNLKGNRIQLIKGNFFENNENLERLDLSENIITWISEFAFSGAYNLKYLDLSKNLLTNINSKTFEPTSSLIFLNLSRNLFNTFYQLRNPSIVILDLSHNEITSINPDSINHLQSLKTLNLSYNFLEILPTPGFSSRSLENLDLSYCRIMFFNSSIVFGLPILKTIDLTGNRLIYIQNSSLLVKNVANRLLLANNPWRCDCFDENFLNIRSYFNKTQLNELTCLSPTNVSGWSWIKACDFSKKINHENSTTTKDWLIMTIISLALIFAGFATCIVIGIQEKLCKNRNTSQTENAPRLEDLLETIHVDENLSPVNRSRITESVQRLSQLPSYDEALLFPKFTPSEESLEKIQKNKKRQSGTQTEETMLSLFKNVTIDCGLIEQSENRRSMQEIVYINLPNPIQSTEL